MKCFPIVRRLQRQGSMWSAYLWFCVREYGLRRLPPEAKNNAKKVLMISLSDWPERIKMEGMIAKSLQMEGRTPVILTYRSFAWAQRYFRAFGVDQFVFLDDLQKEVQPTINAINIEELVASHTSFDALHRYEKNGIGIGRHVLSTMVRQLKNGSPAFSDPAVLTAMRTYLPESLMAAEAAHLLLDRVQPEVVLFLEKGYTPYGEIFDAALNRHIPAIQYHHGQRSDVVVMKRYTRENRFQHPFSLSKDSWNRVRELPWTEAQEESFMQELRGGYENGTWLNRKFLLTDKKLKAPQEVRTQLGLDPAKKTAVIFSHVLWDATFFFGKNLFEDYEQWLIATVKEACANTSVQWIIKVHPDYAWKMKEAGGSREPRDTIALAAQVGTLPPHISIVLPDTDISTYAFFPITDYCITVRGTIGIEAPCFGIPVITAGTGRYSGLGFTNDSQSIDEYIGKLRHIADIPRLTPAETSLARRHAYSLFHLRPLPFTSFEMKPVSKNGKFDHHTIIRAHTLADIRNATDLTTFTHWVLHSTAEDYLHLPAS